MNHRRDYRFWVVVFLIHGFALARNRDSSGVIPCMFSHRRQNINRVDLPLTNWGEFGRSEAGVAGTIWPKGSGEPYIFGAGIWIGALVGDDTLVSCGYNTVGRGCDFIPGPPDSIHIWDHFRDPTSHPEDRVYLSTDSLDFAQWPLRDEKGNPMVISDQDAWCEYNDFCDSLHLWESGTYPLKLWVTQRSLTWVDALREDIVFIQYSFKNMSEDIISNIYVGIGADTDVGSPDNDLLGGDIKRNLGYTYTIGQEAGWESLPPYYVGIVVKAGPRADDTIRLPRPGLPDTIIYPGQKLPLTSFTGCTRAYDASNEFRRYSMLAGYNIETGEYDPWMGLRDEVPADKRMIIGCGPFKLTPGEEDSLQIALVFANGATGGLERLKSLADYAISGVKEKKGKEPYSILRIYPNPSYYSVEITYRLTESSKVNLGIYNVLGERLRRLVNEFQEEGLRRIVWDGRDKRSAKVSSGVYFCRIKAGGFSQTRPIVIIK